MKYIAAKSTDIYYNLALEEYLFDHYRDDSCLLLWRNDASVVLGKYQNAFEEVNLKEIEKRQLKVARRNTGGGTVFHDLGNLNYSFITDYDPEHFSNYDVFLNPVIAALNKLGIPAAKRNQSDIAIGDRKISGSAQSIKKGRILHHGTLLFDADLSELHTMLKPTEGRIESKAVKSVRSKVVNMKEYIKDPAMTVSELEEYLLENLSFEEQSQELILSEYERKTVMRTSKEKYSTWEWNFGKSPSFTFQKRSKNINVKLSVKQGKIMECDLEYESPQTSNQIREKLINGRYSYCLVENSLTSVVGADQAEAVADCFF